MAFFTAFFDASGNPKDHPFVIVSGYVANYLQWQLFEGSWARAHKDHGVELPFHASAFVAACETSTYSDQSNARPDYIEIAQHPERVNSFIKALGFVQLSGVHCGISCIIEMDAYNEIDSVLSLSEIVPPFALGARMCIDRLHQWEKMFAIPEPAEYIFEEGDFGQGKFTDLMVNEGEAKPIYKKKTDYGALQAADQYAWEQFYALGNFRSGLKREHRIAASWLLHSIPKLHTHAPLETLIRLCHAKGISPRIIK